jgi:Flp pilus assembly secretin CpaC
MGRRERSRRFIPTSGALLTHLSGIRRSFALAAALVIWTAVSAAAQITEPIRIDLPIGRSFPISTTVPISRVSIAAPEVADVVVIGEREVVINARAAGETDAIIWQANGARQHYRVSVHSPADRMQIAVHIKFAEVRRDALRELSVSGAVFDKNVNASSGLFDPRSIFPADSLIITATRRFLSIFTDFGTDKLVAWIEAQEQAGRAKVLAEPTILAANKEEANFLAGGELPVPVVQAGAGDAAGSRVTIEYREFGVRLNFLGEIISDSLVKLRVRPEVSSLDFVNAVLVSGFRVPAFRTRRVESTIDVRRDRSLIISGMFSTEEERVKTGIPLLMHIPILGQLFSSTRFQKNESELIVIVTPVIIDPMRPPPEHTIRLLPDTTLPAREAIEKRLAPEGAARP